MNYAQYLTLVLIAYLAYQHLTGMWKRRERTVEMVKERLGYEYYMIPEGARNWMLYAGITIHMMVWPLLVFMLYEGGFFK